jgi:hypothetical protein
VTGRSVASRGCEWQVSERLRWAKGDHVRLWWRSCLSLRLVVVSRTVFRHCWIWRSARSACGASRIGERYKTNKMFLNAMRQRYEGRAENEMMNPFGVPADDLRANFVPRKHGDLADKVEVGTC